MNVDTVVRVLTSTRDRIVLASKDSRLAWSKLNDAFRSLSEQRSSLVDDYFGGELSNEYTHVKQYGIDAQRAAESAGDASGAALIGERLNELTDLWNKVGTLVDASARIIAAFDVAADKIAQSGWTKYPVTRG